MLLGELEKTGRGTVGGGARRTAGAAAGGCGAHAAVAAPQVGVLPEGDLLDAALLALVERLGFTAGPWSPGQPGAAVDVPAVLILRNIAALPRIPTAVRRSSRVVVMETKYLPGADIPGIDVIPATAEGADLLDVLLTDALGRPPRRRVSMSDRERAVLATYILGATVKETAREHYIAESTVRTHYRRAVQRYADIGRPAANKTELLLRMVADGWVELEAEPRRTPARGPAPACGAAPGAALACGAAPAGSPQ